MDKSREQFEGWFNEIGKLAVLADTLRDGAGNYYFAETRLLWECWQASRAALVVELPKVPKLDFGDEFTNGAEFGKEIMLDDVTDILKQAGIKCS